MMERWEYIALHSWPKSGTFYFDAVFELTGDGYTFATVDEALRVLGAEGWECILCHRDDGPRQQIIPGTLIQAPPWPVKYELRFKRRLQ